MCHQIDRHGAVVGPQLDGVGSRGAERLIEDVMDPHRNVDKSFQMTRLIYANGDVEGGLLAREEDGQLFLIQSNGEEKPVQRSLVASIEPTARSLMPDNFGELFTDKQWADLLAFLLGKR
jgi:putative heme-binding domain-containing protein